MAAALSAQQVSILQHLTNPSMKTKMSKDKKMIEGILAHALEIIYLLTGEEYTIVKKSSPHNSIHQLTGEGNINGLKENQRFPWSLGISASRKNGFQDENVDIIKEEEEDETNEKDILQLTIHSDLYTGRQDENLHTVSINENGEYEREEKDIQQVEIHSDPIAGSSHLKPSIFPTFEREKELNMMSHQQIKGEIVLNTNKHGFIRSDTMNTHTAACYPTSVVEDEANLSQKVKNEKSGKTMPKESTKAKFTSATGSHQHEQRSCSENESFAKERNDAACRGMNLKKKTTDLVSRIVPQEDHHSSHIGEKLFNVPDWGRGFNKRTQLVQHQRNHTGGKPYACFDCDKLFTTRSHLVIHQRTHTGEKPYVCPECGKGFSQRSDLVTHHRTHTGEKPYICQICGKGSYRRSDLVKHHRTHTGEKPYVCPDCGKSFSERSNLVKHRRTHTRDKPYLFT